MDFLYFLKNILKHIVDSMENRPVVSAGIFTILGIILSAILDIREHYDKIITKSKNLIKQKINVNNKKFIFKFFNNWTFLNRVENKGGGSNKEVVNQEIKKNSVKSPLNTDQVSICLNILRITETYTASGFDPKEIYEKAVKERNTAEGIEMAARTHFILFSNIISSIGVYATKNGANEKVGYLQTLVAGLEKMLEQSTEVEALERQIDDCERAVLNILLKLPYDSA